MNLSDALQKMVPPSQKRPNAYRGGIMQIHVTRACDKACFGCTQGSNLAGKSDMMTPEQFEQAVLSMEGYWGVIGVFGGNPAISKHFDDYCRILQKHVPFKRRGLWCNKLFGKGAICRETFNPNVCNLNVHMDREAWDEFKRDWPEAKPFGLDVDSRHSPPYVAMQDVIEDESKRYELISNCDINQNWSAMICLVNGELRAYFCEIAAAQAILHQNDPSWPVSGLEVVPGWWREPMESFKNQVEWHCHRCGIPLRGHGELAQGNGKEQVSKTHADIFKPKTKNRPVETVTELYQIQPKDKEVTEYLGK